MTFSYLLSSEVEETEPNFRDKPNDSTFVELRDLVAYLASREVSDPQYYIVEIFGGNSGVIKIGIQRKLRCGRNIDICTGADLTIPEEAKALIK